MIPKITDVRTVAGAVPVPRSRWCAGGRQAEEQITRTGALLQLAQAAIFVRGPDGRGTYWNAGMCAPTVTASAALRRPDLGNGAVDSGVTMYSTLNMKGTL